MNENGEEGAFRAICNNPVEFVNCGLSLEDVGRGVLKS